MNQLFSSLTNFVLIFPISSGVLKGTGNREQATVTSLEEDLDLSQTSSVLKDGASDQGNGQQYSSVACCPFPVPSEALTSVRGSKFLITLIHSF